MKYRRRIFFTDKQKSDIWDRWQRGESMSSIGRLFDRESSSIYPLLARTGGTLFNSDHGFSGSVFFGLLCETHSNNGLQKRLRHSAVVAE